MNGQNQDFLGRVHGLEIEVKDLKRDLSIQKFNTARLARLVLNGDSLRATALAQNLLDSQRGDL